MFVGHLLVVRRSLAREVGGFDPRFDNVQDFEFMLRLSERTDRIAHVPRVLYRWRRIPGSWPFTEMRSPRSTCPVRGRHSAPGADGRRCRRAPASDARASRPDRRPTSGVPARDLGRPRGRERRGLDATLDALAAAQLDIRDVAVCQSDEQRETVAARGLAPREDKDEPALSDVVLCVESGLIPVTRTWLADMLLHAAIGDVAAVSAVVLGPDGLVEQAGAILGLDSGWGPALRAGTRLGRLRRLALLHARGVGGLRFLGHGGARETQRLGGFAPIGSERLRWLEFSLRASNSGLRNIVSPRAIVRRAVATAESPAPLDEWLVRNRWAAALATNHSTTPTSSRSPAAMSREPARSPVNVLFVSHCNFTGNSAFHVLAVALELAKPRSTATIAVPDRPETVDDAGRPSFPVVSYDAARSGGVVFPDGRGPDLVHAFTPREHVRNLTVALSTSHRCPYVVHFEDNEDVVLADELNGTSPADLLRMPLAVSDTSSSPRDTSAARTALRRGGGGLHGADRHPARI